jgi:hypothetical protein
MECNLLLLLSRSVKMYTTKKKIQKDKDAEPTEFEETVAQVSSLGFYLITCIPGLNESIVMKSKCFFFCRHYLTWKIPAQTWKVI